MEKGLGLFLFWRLSLNKAGCFQFITSFVGGWVMSVLPPQYPLGYT